jgi:hypothetical protein
MSDVMEVLTAASPSEAIPQVSSVLFRVGDVSRVVEFCRSERVAVVGLEGFHRHGASVKPDLDCIADFSSAMSEVDACADAAQRILVVWASDPDLLVELVL